MTRKLVISTLTFDIFCYLPDYAGTGKVCGIRDIDTTINWGNGKAHLFKGKDYVRYLTPKNVEGVLFN
jgi:hypothetical protein